jgi:hypothetical protein
MIKVGKKQTLDRCPVCDDKVDRIVQELSLLLDECKYLCRDLFLVIFPIFFTLPFALYWGPHPAIDEALDMVGRKFFGL